MRTARYLISFLVLSSAGFETKKFFLSRWKGGKAAAYTFLMLARVNERERERVRENATVTEGWFRFHRYVD